MHAGRRYESACERLRLLGSADGVDEHATSRPHGQGHVSDNIPVFSARPTWRRKVLAAAPGGTFEFTECSL